MPWAFLHSIIGVTERIRHVCRPSNCRVAETHDFIVTVLNCISIMRTQRCKSRRPAVSRHSNCSLLCANLFFCSVTDGLQSLHRPLCTRYNVAWLHKRYEDMRPSSAAFLPATIGQTFAHWRSHGATCGSTQDTVKSTTTMTLYAVAQPRTTSLYRWTVTSAKLFVWWKR